MKRLLKISLLTISLSSIYIKALDIPTYYKLDLKAMELTLQGAKDRLKCLKRDCNLSEQYAIDDKVQQNISKLYKSYGTTPSKHIGFYTQHQIEAKKYFDKNETLQDIYKNLQNEIEDINSQIKEILEEEEE